MTCLTGSDIARRQASPGQAGPLPGNPSLTAIPGNGIHPVLTGLTQGAEQKRRIYTPKSGAGTEKGLREPSLLRRT
jgi:hypothetical protein